MPTDIFDHRFKRMYKAVVRCLNLELAAQPHAERRGKLFHLFRYYLAFMIKTGGTGPDKRDLGPGCYEMFLRLLKSQSGAEVEELLPSSIFGVIGANPSRETFHTLALRWFREGYSAGCYLSAYAHCYVETSGFFLFGRSDFSEQDAENIFRSGARFDQFCALLLPSHLFLGKVSELVMRICCGCSIDIALGFCHPTGNGNHFYC
jgi:hypothetical protein